MTRCRCGAELVRSYAMERVGSIRAWKLRLRCTSPACGATTAYRDLVTGQPVMFDDLVQQRILVARDGGKRR